MNFGENIIENSSLFFLEPCALIISFSNCLQNFHASPVQISTHMNEVAAVVGMVDSGLKLAYLAY